MAFNYSSFWISYTKINDFLTCPRGFYLKHLYKNPKTGKKIQVASPHLSLGSAIHEVLENLANIESHKRFNQSLIERLDEIWPKYSGKKGGFGSLDMELEFKKRAEEMLRKVMKKPQFLENKSVKLDKSLLAFPLSLDSDFILCGKVDWLEFIPEDKSIHICDFKTGQNRESEDSLQLGIYYWLVSQYLASKQADLEIKKMTYWYLESDLIEEKKIPQVDDLEQEILKIGKKMKLAIKLNSFSCPKDGCFCCQDLEQVVNHKAELVGISDMGREIYYVEPKKRENKQLKLEII
jgi:CRISPR/Cas system-associated exonuclease Cas4 (RecB family)